MFNTNYASRVDVSKVMFESHKIGLSAPKASEGKLTVKVAKVAKVERLTPSKSELSEVVYPKAEVIPFNECGGVAEWIALNNIHVGITRGVIRIIGTKVSYTKTGKPFFTHDTLACWDIVKSRYDQEIVSDMEQQVYITLFELCKQGKAFYNSTLDRLEFLTYENEKGETKSYFNRVYSTIREVLGVYKKSSTSSEIPASDLIYFTEGEKDFNGNTLEVQHVMSKDNPLYTHYSAIQYDGGLKGLINDGRIVAIMHYIKAHTSPTKYKTIVKVVEGLILGLTYDEIATRYNMGIATVKRARKDLKDLYQAYGSIELTKPVNYRFGGSLKSYGRALNNPVYGSSGARWDNMEYIYQSSNSTPSESYKLAIKKREYKEEYKKRKAFNSLLGRVVSDILHDGIKAFNYEYEIGTKRYGCECPRIIRYTDTGLNILLEGMKA